MLTIKASLSAQQGSLGEIRIKSSLFVGETCYIYRDDFMPSTLIKGSHPDWIN